MENSKGLKIASTVFRYLLGLIFFVFGLNKFLQFLPPPELEGAAGAYMGGLAGSGYFFPMLGIVEVVTGILLLIGFYVPLAIVLLAPVTLNIFLFHVSVEPSGLPIGGGWCF